MRVSHLSLAAWRNYRTAEFQFESGANILLGPNGQGKTNALEAIAYLSTQTSHRLAQSRGLIRSGDSTAIVRARMVNGTRSVTCELQLNADRPNVAQVSGNSVRPRELSRYCHTVLFSPEDLSIVRGDPAERRSFVDELLVQLSPRMSGVLSDYDRVVKQRNNLLKTARHASSLSTLEIWDEKLIELGTEIIAERQQLTSQLLAPVAEAYAQLAGADHSPGLSWQYSWGEVPEADVAQTFREQLDRVHPNERERGVTLVGPHRDDLLCELNQLPVKGFASHGESWSFVLALRLASAHILRERSDAGDPILLLDDVFAELDARRRSRLAEAVADVEQVIISAAVAGDIPEQLTGPITHIRAGSVVEASHE